MNKLNRFYLSQNVSIDNALSMNQILHQIVNQIKEIVDFINNLELRANEYTDQEIIKLNDKLQAQLETLEQTLKTYTDDSIDTYNATIINPQLTEIRNTIDTINRTINERIDDEVGVLNRRISSVESTLNKKIDDTKEYLEELIRKGNQLVYSSISGRKIPIQDTLFEMGNALKQILSYNWNSVNEFKNAMGFEFNEILSEFNIPYGNTRFTKGILKSSIPIEDGHQYVYFKLNDNVDSHFNDKDVGYSVYTSYGYGINENEIIGASGPFSLEKIDDDLIRCDVYNVDIQTYNYIFIGCTLSLGLGEYAPIANDLTKVNVYWGDEVEYDITFNSLKLAMQELNVNWNALSFTGVNTFYELNETEKMYDSLGVKSDYFANDKYKVVHNNFESDFFKSNIN